MKKFAYMAAVAVAINAVPAVSSAKSGQFYGSVKAITLLESDADYTSSTGLSGNIDYDFGAGFGAAFGYYINDNLRTDFELTYGRQDVSQDTNGAGIATAAMMNLYYDFDIKGHDKIKPYVGAGVGYMFLEATNDIYTVDDEDTVLGYQAMAGVGYELNNNHVLSLGYRYQTSEDPEFKGTGFSIEFETQNHLIDVAYRIPFSL